MFRSAEALVKTWRDEGGGTAVALQLSRGQLDALAAGIGDDNFWRRLQDLVRRAGDPWNADDWPLGFDPLLCVVPLCKTVDYECARCVLGQTQAARSCAHPSTDVAKIGQLIAAGKRAELLRHVEQLQARIARLG